MEKEGEEYGVDKKIEKMLLKNGFRLNELYYENLGTFQTRKKKEDGTDEEGGYGSHKSETISASGIMVYDDKIFGMAGRDYAKKMALLQGFDEYVFTNFTFKSKMFRYTVYGHITDSLFHQRKKFNCSELMWEPMPFTLSALEHFVCNIMALELSQLEDFIQTAAKEEDYITLIRSGENPQMTLPQDDFLQYIGIHFPTQFESMLKKNKEAKRYFLHCEMRALCHKTEYKTLNLMVMEYPAFYSEKMVVEMEWDHIIRLYHTLKTECHVLAFNDLIEYKYKVTKEMKLSNPDVPANNVPLPEISFAAVNFIVDNMYPESALVVDTIKKCAVCMYENLKMESFNGKHIFVHGEQLYRMTNSSLFDAAIKDKALEFLIDKHIVEVNAGNEVSVRYMYLWEKCIAVSVSLIYQRFSQKGSAFNISTKNLRTFAGHRICDEQENAISVINQNPVVMINGRPGSGKTDMLGIIASHIRPEDVLAVAMKGIHVSKLNKIFPGRAFTPHMLLYFHDKNCKKSPHYDPSSTTMEKTNNTRNRNDPDPIYDSDDDRGNRNTPKKINKLNLDFKDCIFERVKYVVYEEASNWDEGTFSKMISASVICGNIRGILLLGDSNQLPSIRTGNLIKEMTHFCQDMKSLCEFHHNHRSGRASQILNLNLEALLQRNVQGIKFDDRYCVHMDLNATNGNKKQEINRLILQKLEEDNMDEYKHHVITRTNDYKDSIGLAIEEFYCKKDPSHAGEFKNRGFNKNRKISFTQNNYMERIMNNELLILYDIVDTTVRKMHGIENVSVNHKSNTGDRIDSGSTRRLFFRNLGGIGTVEIDWIDWTKKHLKKASASTVQVFQGSEMDHIFMVIPYASEFETFESIYTMWSRCIKGLVVVCNLRDLAASILRNEPARRSNLHHLMIESCKRYRPKTPSLSISTDTTDRKITIKETDIVKDEPLVTEIASEASKKYKYQKPNLKAEISLSKKPVESFQNHNKGKGKSTRTEMISSTQLLASMVKKTPKTPEPKKQDKEKDKEAEPVVIDDKMSEVCCLIMDTVSQAELDYTKIFLKSMKSLSTTDESTKSILQEAIKYFDNDQITKPLKHARSQQYQLNVLQQLNAREDTTSDNNKRKKVALQENGSATKKKVVKQEDEDGEEESKKKEAKKSKQRADDSDREDEKKQKRKKLEESEDEVVERRKSEVVVERRKSESKRKHEDSDEDNVIVRRRSDSNKKKQTKKSRSDGESSDEEKKRKKKRSHSDSD